MTGWERVADCGAMRVVRLHLEPGQRVPEHRTAIPVVLVVLSGVLHYSEGEREGRAEAGAMLLIDPGERHAYRAEAGPVAAYLVFAGLPGVRARLWRVGSAPPS